MGEVYKEALEALKRAYAEGYQFVIFCHGASTSRPGQTTARSMVRTLMRSKESTPYIVKSRSIQHPTVFVAAICKRKETCQAMPARKKLKKYEGMYKLQRYK